ncbi:MAG: hypothetical protein K0R61_4634 [Microvirga sp.]|nr:hypothetical protein [Microvirga sp.]
MRRDTVGIELQPHLSLMPRFYFDVMSNGVATTDEEGVDLRSTELARNEAMRTAAEMAKEEGSCAKDVVIHIRDGSGPLPIATVRLSLTCEP